MRYPILSLILLTITFFSCQKEESGEDSCSSNIQTNQVTYIWINDTDNTCSVTWHSSSGADVAQEEILEPKSFYQETVTDFMTPEQLHGARDIIISTTEHDDVVIEPRLESPLNWWDDLPHSRVITLLSEPFMSIIYIYLLSDVVNGKSISSSATNSFSVETKSKEAFVMDHIWINDTDMPCELSWAQDKAIIDACGLYAEMEDDHSNHLLYSETISVVFSGEKTFSFINTPDEAAFFWTSLPHSKGATIRGSTPSIGLYFYFLSDILALEK